MVTAGASANVSITGDGVHVLSFYTVDVDGNIEPVQQVIIQIDTTAPVITLNGSSTQTLECGVDSYTELGATVTDNLDPGVVVVIGGDTVDTFTCGIYVVTYDSIDAAGNPAVQMTRTVTVQDTIAPVISITSPADSATYYIDEVVLADFIVTDIGSGIATVTPTVALGAPIDTASEGAKTFSVSATDNASNNSVTVYSYTVIPRGNIDPNDDDSQYAWGENIGWLNFGPNKGPGVTASDSNVVGYVWAENIGWINLLPSAYGGIVNDGAGNLSGYAWGENVGWINFNPVNGGVTIDSDGNFDGYAWGENTGWIKFSLADYYVVACKVTFEDLANFISYWLDIGMSPADLDGQVDGVDFGDYSIFSGYWRDFCPDGWQLK